MVSDFTWITMLFVGMVCVVVAMFMLSAYLKATKKDKSEKSKNK